VSKEPVDLDTERRASKCITRKTQPHSSHSTLVIQAAHFEHGVQARGIHAHSLALSARHAFSGRTFHLTCTRKKNWRIEEILAGGYTFQLFPLERTHQAFFFQKQIEVASKDVMTLNMYMEMTFFKFVYFTCYLIQ
jgi:hypothetical protein